MEEEQEKSRSNWPIMIAAVVLIAVGVWYLSSQRIPGSVLENGSAPVAQKPPDIKILKVEAKNGKFDPDEFSVKRGPTLIIEFSAVDAKYDFGFADPKIGFDVIVDPGKTQRFGFETKDKPAGSYKFKCIQFCPKGPMSGVLKIE